MSTKLTTKKLHPLEAALRKLALAYPDAREEFPWGERVVKVNKKVFIFMGARDGKTFGLSVKLPHTGAIALELPFCEPTGYGLGKAGWVSAAFGPKQKPPLDMLEAWLDESYRAVAPKKLVAKLDGEQRPPVAKRPPPKRAR